MLCPTLHCWTVAWYGSQEPSKSSWNVKPPFFSFLLPSLSLPVSRWTECLESMWLPSALTPGCGKVDRSCGQWFQTAGHGVCTGCTSRTGTPWWADLSRCMLGTWCRSWGRPLTWVAEEEFSVMTNGAVYTFVSAKKFISQNNLSCSLCLYHHTHFSILWHTAPVPILTHYVWHTAPVPILTHYLPPILWHTCPHPLTPLSPSSDTPVPIP